MNDRDFKGIWIPKEVYLDTRLNALEKILLVEIDSLSSEEKGCFASNKYLADFCQCSETKVSTGISKLMELGYVESENFDGRSRILKSSLSNFERQTFKKCKAASQNLKHSNKDINNRLINKTNNIPPIDPPTRFVKPTVEEVKAYCIERGNNVDAQKWFDYYTANGWKVGRNPMKDWKAAVRTWERTEKKKSVDYEAMARDLAMEMI